MACAKMANRDRGVHCSCDTQGRGGERELGEEGKEVGQEGPVCTVKCCSLSLEQMGERERKHTKFASLDTSFTWPYVVSFCCVKCTHIFTPSHCEFLEDRNRGS